MERTIITLSTSAAAAIKRLQHACGTFDFYNTTLTRLFNLILDQSDELGMSYTEAINTLRALRYLNDDITNIAGKGGSPEEIRIEADMDAVDQSVESVFNESAEKEEETFSGVTVPGDQLDEPREMLHDIKVAIRNVVNAIDAIAAAKEYLDDALDYAKRSETLDKA